MADGLIMDGAAAQQMSKAAARPSLGQTGSNESSLKQHKKQKQAARSCHLVIQQTSAEPY